MIHPRTATCFPLFSAALFGLWVSAHAWASAQTSDAYATRMRAAVEKHDAGAFAGAAAMFEAMAGDFPEAGDVRFEWAGSLFAAGKVTEALAVIEEALKLPNAEKSSLYLVQGNCLSTLNRKEEALAAFDAGLAINAANPYLHFNKGIALFGSGRTEDGVASLKEAARIKPDYASAYSVLAQAFEAQKYRIPSVFNYLRFLTLEPVGHRAQFATRQLLAQVGAGTEKKSDGISLNLGLALGGPTSEGNYQSLDLALSLSAAAAQTDEASTEPACVSAVKPIMSLVEIVAESRNEPPEGASESFTWQQSVLPVLALHEQGVLETLLIVQTANLGMEGGQTWYAQNREKTAQLKAALEAQAP